MIKVNADPVLIIYFTPKDKTAVPPFIPIYLSEEITGLVVRDESFGLSVATDNVVANNSGEVVYQQKGITNKLAIELIGRRDSIGLNLIVPTFTALYKKVIAKSAYRLAYFHQNQIIFDAILSSFETKQTDENNLLAINIVLEVPAEKENKKETVQKAGYSAKDVPVKAAA